jgi:S-DNA-T family DNA segregation ATPase FtsK/SpoIIIE
VDVGVGGTVLVAGGAGSGRSTLLRTLALSAARRLRPDQLHIHAIDTSGCGLAELAAVPHVGTVVTARDGFEVAARLVIRLARAIADDSDGGAARPAVLLILDGWDGFVAGAEEYDGARTVDRLHTVLGDAPGVGATVVITGGRAVLAPRLATHAATRLILSCHDPADYAAAGVDARSVPTFRAGRGIRAALRLRALPTRVALANQPTAPGHVVLGAGGDDARVVSVALGAGAGRVLVAGPPGSGRSQFLITVLHQSLDRRLLIAASTRSPLAIAAARHGVRVLMPRDSCADDAMLDQLDLLLLDDVETFADTELGDVLTRWVRDGPPGLAVCAAGRSDALAVTFRGLGTELRRARCGVLLQPAAGDGALFSARLPRARAPQIPGRGLLFPDPVWALPDAPVPIQLAVSPCADTCGPWAGRRSP